MTIRLRVNGYFSHMKKQLLFLFFGMLQLLVQSQPVTGKQPNVIIIVADQWRGQALGFLHQEKVKTPNLDRLAAQSLVLTNFISNYPVCSLQEPC